MRKRPTLITRLVQSAFCSGYITLSVLLISLLSMLYGNSACAEEPGAEKKRTDSGPKPYEGFEGKIGRTFRDSKPWWPSRVQPPEGAPNIMIVLADDLGFSDLGCFGSEIQTPNVDRLAAHGLQFNNFTVHPICSPTRAALLTGLNAHSVGVGWIANCNPGYPGYAAEISPDAVTITEILRDHGYSTMMVGKWHLTYDHNMSPTGPFDSWPLQRGFEHFYGFLEAETHSMMPHRLYEGNQVVNVDQYPEDYFTADDWTDHAIAMIKDHQASDPERPFFLYVSHNSVHAPICSREKDRAKYCGRYDKGWNKIREERYQRQLKLGIIPAGTRLPEMNPGIKNWEELSEEDKKYFARHQENFAAYVDNLDQNFGRLYSFLEEIGQLDDTILIFTSDNGASPEGGLVGETNTTVEVTPVPVDHEFDLTRTDLIGTAQTWSHYPLGWTTVSNTPFKRYKRYTYEGGRHVPFIISWPARIKEKGVIRPQFIHVTDLVPTLLEIIGIKHPKTYQGRRMKTLEGVSFAYLLDEANANEPSQHTEQYYEIEGHRAYYQDGWVIVSEHTPGTPFDDSNWELYHLTEDFSESNNLAPKYPQKVKEMIKAFDQAAWKYQVYPLDDRGLERISVSMLPQVRPRTFYPGTPTVIRTVMAPLYQDRSYTISAKFNYRMGDEGVIYADGDQGGGYLLYVEGGKIFYEYNAYGPMIKLPGAPIEPGDLEVVFDFKATGKRKGTGTLSVNGKKVAEGEFYPAPWGWHEGLDIGLDRRGPVSWQVYKKHGPFPYTGTIYSVSYLPGPLAPDSIFHKSGEQGQGEKN